MAERTGLFRAYRIEQEESNKPKGRMVKIGLSDLNEGDLIVRTRYSNLNYKDALAATGAGKIAWRLPIVGGVDVAGTVEVSEDPRFEPGDEVLVTGFGLSEDRDGGYSEVTRLTADYALKLPEGLDTRSCYPSSAFSLCPHERAGKSRWHAYQLASRREKQKGATHRRRTHPGWQRL